MMRGTELRTLSLFEKFMCLVDVASRDLKLSGADYAVLIMLVQRHNPKTGLCNPSVARMAADTGYSTRTVYASIEKLEKLEILIRTRGYPGTSNLYVFRPIPVKRISQRFGRPAKPTEIAGRVKNTAQATDGSCVELLNHSSPKKEKENKKEKWDAQKQCLSSEGMGIPKLKREEFESYAAAHFERVGPGYEGLLECPADDFEHTFEQYNVEQIGLDAAMKKLVELFETVLRKNGS